MTDLVPTQADREAAAAMYASLYAKWGDATFIVRASAEKTQRGERDQGTIVQAFAAHAAAARLEALEKAAVELDIDGCSIAAQIVRDIASRGAE